MTIGCSCGKEIEIQLDEMLDMNEWADGIASDFVKCPKCNSEWNMQLIGKRLRNSDPCIHKGEHGDCNNCSGINKQCVSYYGVTNANA
jgi:hypothetical protein